MLVVFNDSPKHLSKQVRGIIGRYCWKIGRDLWIWRKPSIKDDIIKCLEEIDPEIRILFIWKDSKKPLGFQVQVFGDLKARQTHDGLFNHFIKL
jgi:hypothetical protein